MKTLAIAIAIVAPLEARAFEWTAAAGVAYSRGDAWNEADIHTSRPRLDLHLNLEARDYFSSPGIFQWSGGAGYFRVADRPSGAPALLSDVLTYHFDAALFRHRGSPFTTSFYAQRADSRFGPSLSGVGVGDRRFDILGGSLSLAPPGLPFLTAGYDHQTSTETIPGVPLRNTQKDLLSASLTHSNAAFGLTAQYRGEWSDGTWVADQLENYSVTASAQSLVGNDARVFLSEAYFQQVPTTSASGAVEITTNAFQSGFLDGLLRGEQTRILYTYARARTAALAVDRESTAQSVRTEQDLLLTRDGERSWIKLLGVGSTTRQRSGAILEDGMGLTFGAQYRRAKTAGSWEAGGGPVIAYLKTATASNVGYGASADGRMNRPWGSHRIGLSYAVDYSADAYGRSGSSLTQSLSASLSGSAFGRSQFTTNLTASARRGWSPIMGDEASRSLQLDGRLTMSRYTVDGSASLASGVAGTAPREFMGDGLFLPAAFNSHTVFARLGGTAKVVEGLVGGAEIRYADNFLPGQPDYSVIEGRASVTYRYAAFDFSLEDRVSRTGSSLGSATGNLVMLSVSRTVGTRH